MTNAANASEIAAARAKAKRDRTTDRMITQFLMSSRDGRRWVWMQLEFAQIFQSLGTLDHAQMCFLEGRRNSGLKLFRDVTGFCPSEYILMTNENTGANIEPQAPEQDDDDRTDD